MVKLNNLAWSVLITFFMLSVIAVIPAFSSENARPGSIQVKYPAFKYPGYAQINHQKAMEIALKENSGGILEVELENEDGFLVWDVEIVTEANVIMEYCIDAGNGKILEMSIDEEEEESEEDKIDGSIIVEYGRKHYPELAKVSAEKAIEVALGLVKGKLFSLELEEDDGYLVYEMIVVGSGGVVKEVEVDAGTGEVIEIEELEDDEDD